MNSFVNSYLGDSSRKSTLVDSSVIDAFATFLHNKGFTIPLEIDAEWIATKNWFTDRQLSSDANIHLERLGEMIDSERQRVWVQHRVELKRMLSVEFAAWNEGSTGRYRASLVDDPVVASASKLLHEPKRVESLLAGSTPK